jgi:hypothetical protein
MDKLIICNHKDNSPVCIECKHGTPHSPIKTTSFDETCNEHRAVCFYRRAECICVEIVN